MVKITNSTLFDFDDLVIIPKSLSKINSRKEVKVTDENEMLPLFTAPMDTVINEDNFQVFNTNKIYSLIPRSLNSDKVSCNSYVWYSYGLEEFKSIFLENDLLKGVYYYALLDIANGHMKKLYDLVKEAKEKYGNWIVLMVGNIANPETYKLYAELDVDYIRCGIGGGAGCTTSANCGVHYPMASLIHEIYQIKKENNFSTKIVADGGFQKYADIIKVLALGADYVMLGSIFNKALESSGKLYFLEDNGEYIPLSIKGSFYLENLENFRKSGRIFKNYRGMSTKEVQQSWGKDELKTAEGISKYQKVEYTLEGWCQNFKDYLASAMSYTESFNLSDFKNAELKLITQNSFKRFNK